MIYRDLFSVFDGKWRLTVARAVQEDGVSLPILKYTRTVHKMNVHKYFVDGLHVGYNTIDGALAAWHAIQKGDHSHAKV